MNLKNTNLIPPIQENLSNKIFHVSYFDVFFSSITFSFLSSFAFRTAFRAASKSQNVVCNFIFSRLYSGHFFR